MGSGADDQGRRAAAIGVRAAAGSAALTLALAGLGSAPAMAASTTFGSSLAAPATMAFPHGADTAFWARSLPAGRAVVPGRGRVASIRVKGCAVQSGARIPLTQVHFQTLRGGGSAARVVLTSGPFNMPVCGHGATANTVSTFHPVNLCAHRGDRIAFNDEGGFAPPDYPRGVAYRVLAAAPGATTATYTRANATNNGDTLHGHVLSGTELLMQMTLVTGSSAGVCRTF